MTSYPNYPGKDLEKSYVLPERLLEMAKSRAEGPPLPPPEGVILCYQRVLWDTICADENATMQGLWGMRIRKDTDQRVGIVGGFGFGAPAACVRLEGLIALGVKRFVSIGTAGSLQEDIHIGDLVVCDKAIRDEGSSYHYLAASKYAHASPEIVSRLTSALETLDLPYRLGPSWTIDAPYRETVSEIRRYQREGVATVEMEASALFAVAAYRGVDMGAMFTISDSLAGSEWDPHFGSEEVTRGLHTLYEVATESLR
jgi:uridine phosphorylase